jgi:shikimate kinase
MLKSEDGLEARIKELMSMRVETYERTAHIIIDTDGKSIEEIAEAVRTALMKQ